MDAEWALQHMQRALWDPVDPTRLGSLDSTLQLRVNGEVYRFSSEKTLRRFRESPALWSGLLRDPVTARRFLPSTRSPEVHWFGGPYFFESESTKAVFIEDPKQFQVVRWM